MMLALYSGGTPEQNHTMNLEVVKIIEELGATEIIYITTPYKKNDYARMWIENYLKSYTSLTLKPFFIDKENTSEAKFSLKNAKVILVTGGNTYYIAKFLKKSGTDELLKDFTKKDNTLFIGFSAGSIITTPTIEAAQYPTYDGDLNEVELQDLTGLWLVKFEVVPHYEPNDTFDKELREYSLANGRPIYLLPDGSGIFINGAKEKLFGNISMMDKGEKTKITCVC